MFLFLLLMTALVIAAVSGTIVTVLKDGYRSVPTRAVASARSFPID